jgi:hypothetical protein
MRDPHEMTVEEYMHDLQEVAALGEQMESVLKSDAFQTGLTVARARIFEEWTRASSQSIREELHAEQRALGRLMDAFKTIDEEGAVAREAIRRSEESYTDL